MSDERGNRDGQRWSSSRAATRRITRQSKALGSFARWVREQRTYRQPRWAWIPKNVPAAPDVETARSEILNLDLTPTQLIEGRSFVARLIAEVRDQSEQGADEQVRPVGAWVSLASDSSVDVHIGKYRIATLAGPEAAKIEAAISRWGAGTNTLRADADLLGSKTSDAHLDMFLPTPTDAQQPELPLCVPN